MAKALHQFEYIYIVTDKRTNQISGITIEQTIVTNCFSQVQSLKPLIKVQFCFLLLVVFCNIISVADPKLANDSKKALRDRNDLEGRPISLEAQGQLVRAGRGESRKNYSNNSFQLRLVGLEGVRKFLKRLLLLARQTASGSVLAIPFLAVRGERTSQPLKVIMTFDLQKNTNKIDTEEDLQNTQKQNENERKTSKKEK